MITPQTDATLVFVLICLLAIGCGTAKEIGKTIGALAEVRLANREYPLSEQQVLLVQRMSDYLKK